MSVLPGLYLCITLRVLWVFCSVQTMLPIHPPAFNLSLISNTTHLCSFLGNYLSLLEAFWPSQAFVVLLFILQLFSPLAVCHSDILLPQQSTDGSELKLSFLTHSHMHIQGLVKLAYRWHYLCCQIKGAATTQIVLNCLSLFLLLCCSLSPNSPAHPSVSLLGPHAVVLIVHCLLLRRTRGPTASAAAAAAEERQSWAGGLSRWRRSGWGVGEGSLQGSHNGPALAVCSQLATLALWVNGDNMHFTFIRCILSQL